jgi:hypothetical protein
MHLTEKYEFELTEKIVLKKKSDEDNHRLIKRSSHKPRAIHLFFWLLTISLMIVLTLPVLIRKGMFLDGIVYSAVSRNLSVSIGSFWFPYFDHYNMVNLSSFHEHPPLVFGIESLFFNAFGDSLYVERFYVFLTMCCSAFLINLIWKEIFKEGSPLRKLGWLPVVIWISIPVCFWSFANNMCENTMGIFVLLSVWVMFKALPSRKNSFMFWILAGTCLMLAALCKGFPAFFPLSVPILYCVTTRKISFSKAALYTTLLFLGITVIGLGLYFYPPSHQSLSIYLIKRAFLRINEQPNVDSRSFMLIRLFSELVPAFALTLSLFLMTRFLKIPSRFSDHKRVALFFMSLGLSGSLPFLLTSVQSGYYLVPALPFFGIGFAGFVSSIVLSLKDKIPVIVHKTLLLLSGCLLMGVCIFSALQKNKFSRDERLLHDVEVIGKALPKYTCINCHFSTYQHYSFNSYLIRNFNISLNCVDFNKRNSDYFLTEKNSIPDTALNLQEMNLPMLDYTLYHVRN